MADEAAKLLGNHESRILFQMKNSSIQWCDHTFNCWIGCTHAKTIEGKPILECALCYAETLDDNRFSKTLGGATKANPISHWGSGAPRHRTSAANWKEPLQWNKTAICTNCGYAELIGSDDCRKCGRNFSEVNRRRPRVFCLSLGDWLDEEVPIEWLADLLRLIFETPNLDWQLLTKRPQNWADRISKAAACYGNEWPVCLWARDWLLEKKPPHNVWIGVSAGADQRAALDIPARIHFLSCEPLLKPIDIFYLPTQEFNWIIFGGESGKNARPCYVHWIREGLEFCNRNNIAPFVKQLGAKPTEMKVCPFDPMGAEPAGIILKHSHGGDWNEWPEDLRVRNFPA